VRRLPVALHWPRWPKAGTSSSNGLGCSLLAASWWWERIGEAWSEGGGRLTGGNDMGRSWWMRRRELDTVR
jgi:hypothetical protein